MKYILVISTLIFELAVFASKNYPLVTFEFPTESPEFVDIRLLGPSKFIEDKTKQVQIRCEVYRTFFLLIKDDPGMKGTAYQINTRDHKTSQSIGCAENSTKKKFSFFAGTLEAVFDSVVVVHGEEPFGSTDILFFYDVSTGKEFFSAAYNNEKPFIVRKTNELVQLNYSAHLKSSKDRCNLVQDPSGACLKKVLKRNAIPIKQDLLKLNCEDAVKMARDEVIQGSVDLYLEAIVKDIRKPKLEFMGHKLICTHAP